MNKSGNIVLFASLVFLFFVWIGSSQLQAQDPSNMTKWEYYDKLCKEKGIINKLAKPTDFADRKTGILDVGKVRLGIQNTNLLGYSRQLITYEYPAGSGLTYNWCQALIVGGIINGEKRMSNGAIGCYEDINENHFEPYGGYDSGIGENGIAQSNKQNSWASQWPADSGPIGATGFPGILDNGDVAADVEAFWVAGDDLPDSQQDTPLHVKTYGRALQWSSPLADDFLVFKFYITNVGTDIIKDCYVGVHTDMDAPEEGSGEWMDDFAKFIPVEEDSILGNMLYLWDGDDKSAGFVEKGVAWQGLKMLETPKDANGNELGLTTLVCETYDDFISLPTQADVYDFLSRGIDEVDNVTPHSTDWTETPNTYGPDVTSLHASGPFDLAPGETVTFTIANIFGANKAELMANATLCQLLYNQTYKTAQPPDPPIVQAVASDQEVTLYWDADPSESSVDPLTGNNCFEGYRIYRSTDRGATWGDEITNAMGVTVGYIPIAQYDVKNTVVGISDTNPFFNLGTDSGLKHKFLDKNLKNGVEYWYAVCAYDHDDVLGELVIEPLENSRSKDYSNVVKVIPQAKPAGMQNALISEINHSSGISTGTVEVEMLESEKLKDANYEINFTLDGEQGTLFTVTRDGSEVLSPTPVISPDDPNTGQIPVIDGMRLSVIDEPAGIKEITGSSADYDNNYGTYSYDYYYLPPEINHDYELEFTTDNYFIFPIWRLLGYSDPVVEVNFKVTDVTTNQQIYPIWEDRGSYNLVYDHGENIILNHQAYGPDTTDYPTNYDGYFFKIWADVEPTAGDKLFIKTNKPFTASDVYTFTTNKAVVKATNKDLDEITAVPNPYSITSSFEFKEQEWIKEMQFHGLPETCTIRIFTISGDLVAILHHEPGDAGYRGPSVQAWNLWTYNDQEIAFGVYIFHVNAKGFGEKLGKFAIIK